MSVETRVLILDRSEGDPRPLRDELSRQGFRADVVTDEYALRERLARSAPDVVLLRAAEPEPGLLGMLDDLKARFSQMPVIFACGNDASFVAEGMRRGAFDFVSEPVDVTRLVINLNHAARLHRLLVRVNQLQSQYERRGQFMGLVGVSPRMQRIYSIIESVGATDVTVFVTGPSGTGKELVAKALHRCSPRAEGPFVAINCAAIPKDLLESELFGHERGAFTGATACYRGCCEQADSGTLFLDEICEMDILLQSKLLRFLQERRVNRLGGREEIPIDVRVIAATNRDPAEEVRRGRLREDLYYRLNVVPVEVPPLKDRREDLPLLASVFLERFCAKHGKYFYDFSADAMGALLSYDWPGNVRELENVVERVVVLNNAAQVTRAMLPEAVVRGSTETSTGAGMDEGGAILPMREVERRAITRALAICSGNVARAARRLQIGQATLYRRIKEYSLPTRREEGGRG